MSKRNNKQRLNELDPSLRASLGSLHSTIDNLSATYPELPSFRQSGFTSIDSLRATDAVLGTDMPRPMKLLVRAAFENTGLLIYSTFKKSLPANRHREFRDTVVDLPLEYTSATIVNRSGQLDLMDISVASNASLPAHQRIRTTYIGLTEEVPDDDGLFFDSALQINRYGARQLPPSITLDRHFETQEERAFNDMLDKDILSSTSKAEEVLGTPVAQQATSQDPVMRARAELIQRRRMNIADDAKIISEVNAFDIQELHEHIRRIFSDQG